MWCGWRGSSLSTAALYGKSRDVKKKELSLQDRKGIFSPGKFPLLPRSSPALCSSLLPAGREVGEGRASWPVRAHGASVQAAAGHCGALGMLCEVPGQCQGGCIAEQAPCQIRVLSFGLNSPVF